MCSTVAVLLTGCWMSEFLGAIPSTIPSANPKSGADSNIKRNSIFI